MLCLQLCINYLPVKCVVVEKMLVLRGRILGTMGGRETQYHQDRPTKDRIQILYLQVRRKHCYSNFFSKN